MVRLDALQPSVLHDHHIVMVQVGWFEHLLVQYKATEAKKMAP